MEIVLLSWLCVSAVCDAIYRKFFNWIALLGLIFSIASLFIGSDAHPANFSSALFGGAGVFLVFYVFYVLGMMGAGDVKFAAVLGLWVGWKLFLPIWALSCGFAVLHGLVVRSNLKYFFHQGFKWEDGSKDGKRKFIPYVTYLSIATVMVLIIDK